MDTEAILVALIMLVVCLIPLILIGRLGSGKSKKCLKIINDFAAKNNHDIAEHDQWNNKAIGINSKRTSIFYIHDIEPEVEMQMVDLEKLHSCRIKKTLLSANGEETTNSEVEKIALEFIGGENGKVVRSIDFFNISDGQFSYELEMQLAEKWKAVTDSIIRK